MQNELLNPQSKFLKVEMVKSSGRFAKDKCWLPKPNHLEPSTSSGIIEFFLETHVDWFT